MNEFIMIFRNEKSNGSQPPSAEQMQAVMKEWQTWIKDIATKGNYGSTNRLLSEGKTLKPGNVVSDGPYAEVKEVVGGYLVVKANSLEDAVAMAESCPNIKYGGSVEVRSVMSIDDDYKSPNFLDQK